MLLLFKEVDGDEVGVVDFLHDFIVVFDAEKVFGDLGFEHEAEVVVAMGSAFGFGSFFFNIADNAFLKGGGGKETVERERLIVLEEQFEGLDFRVFAVGVGPTEGEGVEEAFSAEGDVVVGEAHGVHGDEEVGHDAAAAVDGAAMSGLIFQ